MLKEYFLLKNTKAKSKLIIEMQKKLLSSKKGSHRYAYDVIINPFSKQNSHCYDCLKKENRSSPSS